jgi:periplasmic divalent cation tolerance protein
MNKTLVYMTVGSMDEARKIGRTLVEERLAACVNMIDGMQSLYWWENKIQQDREVILLAKTTENLVSRVIERVTSLHSYECPCIVSLPISGGNPAFLEWIEGEVRSSPPFP